MEDMERPDFVVQPDIGQPELGDLEDVQGMMLDFDRLEEMLEELDEFGLTTRDEVEAQIAFANRGASEPMKDNYAGRMEALLEDMQQFRLESREDIVRRMAEYDNQIEDIQTDEEQDLT